MNRSPGCFRSFPASAFLTLAAALFLAVSCTPPQDSGPEPRDTVRDYSYGSDGLQTMDIWFPLEGNASRGAVVIVHGGSWIAGDKTDLDDFIMRRIANLGYVTVTMNYRLADPEPEGAQPVGFSAMLDDIESVLDALDANAAAGLLDEDETVTAVEWFLAWGTADDFVPYATQGVKLELALTAKGAEVASRACIDEGHDLESSALSIIDTDLAGLFQRTIR